MSRLIVSTPLAAGFGAVVLLSACAPAPLYTGKSRVKGAVTQGEIPRDARGEPVWSAIQPTADPAVKDAVTLDRGKQPPEN